MSSVVCLSSLREHIEDLADPAHELLSSGRHALELVVLRGERELRHRLGVGHN